MPGRWQVGSLRDIDELLRRAGADHVRSDVFSTYVTYSSAEHFWSSEMSHGMRGFYASLPSDAGRDFKQEVLETARQTGRDGPITVARAAKFFVATKPTGGVAPS